MKERLVVWMMVVCLAVTPVNVAAAESDYSYLEEMSIKELRELRDAINEILGDNDVSSAKITNEVTEEIFNNSKNAYEKLVDASDIGLMILDDLYEAWYYGIYNEEKGDWDDFCRELTVSSSDLEKGIIENEVYYDILVTSHPEESADMNNYFNLISFLDSFWTVCVNNIIYAYKVAEIGYDNIEEDLNDAKAALKVVGQEYSDYKYYPNLKEFYSEVNSLYEFVLHPSGSFETLTTTKSDFENSIRKNKADLSFVFEE